MFDNYAEGSIKVIMLAQQECRRLGHASLGTEQLLLGLVLEHQGLAARSLNSAGLNDTTARNEVEKLIGRGSGFCPVEIPFTPRAKNVVERAAAKAVELGDRKVRTEHLLLALLDEKEGVGIRVLENCEIDQEQLAMDVIALRKKPSLDNLGYRQGDVVLVQLKSNDADTKKRPMIIITANECIARLPVLAMVPLTSASGARDILDVLISAKSPAGKSAALREDAIAACTFVYSYPKEWITGKVGELPQDTTDEICRSLSDLIRPAQK